MSARAVVLKMQTIMFALVILLTVSGSHAVRAQFLHPKIKSKETTIRRVVVMPAKVNVVRDSMKGPEGMAAESDELSLRVEKMVAEVLSNKKNVTTLSTTTAPSAEGDSEQKYNVADFQTKFDDLLPKIMKKRSDVKKGRFTMGDEVLKKVYSENAKRVLGME